MRRGDYPDPVQRDYYARAIHVARELGGDSVMLVFSDDLAAAEEMFATQQSRAVFVKPPSEATDLESVLLMSQCSIVVTANSTFSWWGGWLGDPSQTTVICPRPWHDTYDISDQDFIPPNWLTVGR